MAKKIKIDEKKLMFGFKIGKDGKPYNPNAKKKNTSKGEKKQSK